MKNTQQIRGPHTTQVMVQPAKTYTRVLPWPKGILTRQTEHSLALKVCTSLQLTRHLPVSYFGPPRAVLAFISNVSSLLPIQVRASHLYVRDATLTSWARPSLLLLIGLVAFC